MFKTYFKSTVFNQLLQPLSDNLSDCRNRRDCPKLSDHDWITIGINRVLDKEPSGRAYLQKLNDCANLDLGKGHFFESLKSKRRLKLCGELLEKINHSMESRLPDPLAQFSSLKDFDIYAGDGHFHAAAAHDPRKGGKKYAVGHLYALNLRTQGVSHLSVGDQINRKKEHDMRGLKRMEIDQLRQKAPKGRKVLYVWDKAGIDFHQWYLWKNKGIYFLSREKENMVLSVSGNRKVDCNLPINEGVLSDQIVSGGHGVAIRRITYYCPVKKETFSFITNLMEIEPGLVALLYKLRWDVEKVFDEWKNKLMEIKAWATTETAKTMQANFVCLAYNLITLMEHQLGEQENIVNEPEIKRREKRLKELEGQLQKQGEQIPYAYKVIQRMTQRGVKLIRWICNHLFQNGPWQEALDSLRRQYRSL